MGFLASIITGPILSTLVDSFLGKAVEAFKLYNEKQISMEELRTRVTQALVQAFVEVEKAYYDAMKSQYHDFMDATKQSVIMQRTWAGVVICQMFVLFWYQWIVPFMTWIMRDYLGEPRFAYPSPGTTIDWAYALVLLCLGGGAIGAKLLNPNPADSLRSLTKR